MIILEPNADTISTFFNCLSRDLNGAGYYEVRILHPDPDPDDRTARAKSRWFPTTIAGLNAATIFAADYNRKGFNAYTTPNPLLSDTPRGDHRAAIDADVACAVVHVLDADSTDHRELAVKVSACGFRPAFWVTTGTVPAIRQHIYFRLDEWLFDLSAWTMMQRRLAAHFDTDPAVCNPSRVMRVAGTVAYPSKSKRERGYIPELTGLSLGSPVDSTVDTAAFYARFPALEKAIEPVVRPAAPDAPASGAVPYAVIAAALDTIPPISRHGERNRWLQVAYACKEAGDYARPLFEAWQRRSTLMHPTDARVWNTLNPRPGSHIALFALAKRENPDWWRADIEVEGWIIETARQRNRGDTSALDRWNNRLKRGLQNYARRSQ